MDSLSLRRRVLTRALRLELGRLGLGWELAIPIMDTAIIPTGTIGDRTTLIPSHIRITVATDTPRTTDVELTTAIITIVITTAIELTSLSEL